MANPKISVGKLYFPQSNFCHKRGFFFANVLTAQVWYSSASTYFLFRMALFPLQLIKSTQTQWLAFAGTYASLSCTGASWVWRQPSICSCCFLCRPTYSCLPLLNTSPQAADVTHHRSFMVKFLAISNSWEILSFRINSSFIWNILNIRQENSWKAHIPKFRSVAIVNIKIITLASKSC